MPNSNLHLKAEPSTKVGTCCVVVSFPLKVDKYVINRLKTGETCDISGDLVDNAIVAYACYKRIQSELMGNATSMSGYKVACVTCGCTPDEFIISAVCDKTISAMRKVAGGIIKNLKFSILSNDYKALCKTLGIKADLDAFAAAVYTAVGAADKSIDVCFTGKFKYKKDQIDSAFVTLENKIQELTDKGKGTIRKLAPQEKTCADHYIDIKANNPMDAVIVHGFLETYVNNSFVCGSYVYVPNHYSTIVEKALTDTAKIDRYTNKLDRLGDEIGGVVGFQGATQGYLAPKSINHKKSYTLAELKRAIKV